MRPDLIMGSHHSVGLITCAHLVWISLIENSRGRYFKLEHRTFMRSDLIMGSHRSLVLIAWSANMELYITLGKKSMSLVLRPEFIKLSRRLVLDKVIGTEDSGLAEPKLSFEN